MQEWILLLSIWSHNRETDEPKMSPAVIPGFSSFENCEEAGKKIAERYGGSGLVLAPWRSEAKKPTDYISFPGTTIQCVEVEK